MRIFIHGIEIIKPTQSELDWLVYRYGFGMTEFEMDGSGI